MSSFQRRSAYWLSVVTLAAGCSNAPSEGVSSSSAKPASPGAGAKVSPTSRAGNQKPYLFSATNLALKVSPGSSTANKSQYSFSVTNPGDAPVLLSSVSIKYWIYETGDVDVVPQVMNGGCITSPSGTCTHPVSEVTATAAPISPDCGPSPTQRANWEITISNNDRTALAAHEAWTNIRTSLMLANQGRFTPGSAAWFSKRPSGDESSAASSSFAVYVNGGLVFSPSGIDGPDCRAPHGSQMLTGYNTPEISSFVPRGRAQLDTLVHLAIGLPVRDPEGLRTFLRNVSDPSSRTFRHFISRAQFTERHGALPTDYRALIDWAASAGLKINATYSNNLLLSVEGSVATVERALHANLVYRKRADGTSFLSVDREPSLDLRPAVLAISGLNQYVAPKTDGSFNGTGLSLSPSPGKSYWGWDFRNAYLGRQRSPCVALDGTGQTVGLVTWGSGFNPIDIMLYQALALPHSQQPQLSGAPTQIIPILIDGFDGALGSTQAEVTGDIESAMSMAPGATIEVYEGLGSNPDAILHAMAVDGTITVASSSFDFIPTANSQTALDEMAGTGVSFFKSSGDSGSASPPYQNGMDGQTLVGGTVLNTNPLGTNPYWQSPENAWFHSGGGVLKGVPIPFYQQSVSMAKNGGSTTFRNYPDVAFVADPLSGFMGGEGLGSGTSASAPFWAGFAALANQELGFGTHGGQQMGFLNPLIYAIGKTRGASGLNDIYATEFHDIADNTSNSNNGSPTFRAVAGYDLVTGWGTPTCALLLQLARGNAYPPQSPCVPSACAPNQCGVVSNGCFGTMQCACPEGKTCFSGLCCTPNNAAEVCAANGTPSCGTAVDNCGQTVTCGPNPCVCETRAQACGSLRCGDVPNGCGGTITCGYCGRNFACDDGVCKPSPPTPPCKPGECS